MNQYEILRYSLYDDPWQDDVPQSYRKFLSVYALHKSLVYSIVYQSEQIFVCRFYYLTKKYKEQRGIPSHFNYELGDVYLIPKYRGQKDKNLQQSISTICLQIILHNMIQSNIILWTTIDNYSAISLYHKLGFMMIPANKKMVTWVTKKFKYLKTSPVFMSKEIKQ